MKFITAALCFSMLCSFLTPAIGQDQPSRVEYLVPSKAIGVSSIVAARNGTALFVYPTFSNTGSTRQDVYFRVRWLDNSGAEIGQGEPWRHLALGGLAMEPVVLSTPLETASDYRLQVSVGMISDRSAR